MKVSVITVCFNSAATIRDTIESVISQDYPDIEYLIVDGNSTDGTMEIVAEYAERIDKIISEPDQGIYDAMNKGIRAASGDVVGTLNSDDLFADRLAISSMAEFLQSNPDLDGAYADLEYVRRTNTERVFRVYSSKWFCFTLIRFGIMLPHPTFYVKRELFEVFGFYKLTYRVAADFELIARFLVRGARLARLPRILVKMREGGISTTGFGWRIHQNLEIVRACRENQIYTNLIMVTFKIPFKLIGYLAR